MKYLIGFIIGAILWRLGGWKFKWIRRFFFPSVIAAYKTKKLRQKALLLIPLLAATFSLGYGEKHPYWYKFLVGVSWSIPRLGFFGFSPIAVALPFIWITLFRLSNWKKTSSIFKWHIVEIITGGLIGAMYA